MQTDNRILDDLARVASSAMGAAGGVKGEFETLVRRQFERVLATMDMVSRDEFDAVKEMAAKARSEQEALQLRVEQLEAALKEQNDSK
ncbi:MAG: accessory factor UbiK family protein [Rhodospirillaceae bacterium]|jgi:BMFP domain-containing protein YqiC|nr:accessory factor UbiK family protein [Rhodospirillaceae bacterium]MBT3629576.1 accessory factor UbiK family protein [Rhodospirillaceae bacterium]MBT3926914.1 accessory factor UbiK family protein [Rhodospirillaceae bacterium]MBT4425780.1 accessory factor UbiK family protein [Rhodospirillaceae bacterium]MBT5037718.1 accessory factor UbiK family protein [Rhodospirillaceae bacterium]